MRTKIVATIGPASQNVKTLEKMIRAGMRVARQNFSHGDHKSHALLIKNIRKAAKTVGVEVAILQDLQGPRIRVGEVPEDGIKLKRITKVALLGERNTSVKIPGYTTVPIQYDDLYRDVKKGSSILIEDGTIQLKVISVRHKIIYCKTKVAGVVKAHKGINVPGVTLNVDIITEKDKKDIKFGQKHQVDYVALSFVKEAADIKQLKALIKKSEKKGVKVPTKVIAKIERQEALDNFPEIIREVDAIMIARGDLGLEIPIAQVPLLQKEIIEDCLTLAKPVIVATQMLDSMIRTPQPTRAEVSDVANAIIDHTDAIMLSGESATGKYPLKAVKMMSQIAKTTEESDYDDYFCGNFQISGTQEALAQAVCQMHSEVGAKAIIIITKSGEGVRLAARHRPQLPILALTAELKTQRQLALSWAVISKKVSLSAPTATIIKQGLDHLKKKKLVKRGDLVIIVGNDFQGKIKKHNIVKIQQV